MPLPQGNLSNIARGVRGVHRAGVPADTAWTSTLDQRYVVIVQRLAPYLGELTVHDGVQIIHRQNVGLVYDAVFGPDVDDVAKWQEIAVRVVDAKFGR